MDTKLILPIEVTIKEKKKMIKGEVISAAIFSRSKIIEVKTSLNDNYYLLYYKNSLVYGGKLAHVEKGSYIDRAYCEGIVVEDDHPFLPVVIPDLTISFPTKQKLFSQLQNQYSLQEAAYIVTTLDSFFLKKQLIQIIDKIYYDYRRNGKFFKSFQMIQLLADFSPAYVKDRMSSQDYYSYDHFYETSSLPELYKKDPLFVEIDCFKNRHNSNKNSFLEDILRKQDCVAEIVLLWMEKVKKHGKAESIEEYTNLAKGIITMEKWILTLCYLNINPFYELKETESVIEKMVNEGHHETAALYLLTFIHDLPSSYQNIFNVLWDHLDLEFLITHLDQFIKVMQSVIQEDQQQVEKKLFQLVDKLFETYPLQTVYEKLQPIESFIPNAEVIQKIKKMITLVEDPDHMMQLGQYYAEFKKYDEAIECFSWEMELHPDDTAPIWQLSKMYQKKGMAEEAKVYQQIGIRLNEYASGER